MILSKRKYLLEIIEVTVSFENVDGKCYVLYVDDNDTDVTKYTKNGPDRFYFKEVGYCWPKLNCKQLFSNVIVNFVTISSGYCVITRLLY